MSKGYFTRGEIWMIGNLWDIEGSEQRGNRPVVIIQGAGLNGSPTVTVAFITSKLDKRGKGAHVWLPDLEQLPMRSMVLTEQLRTVSKTRLNKFVALLDDKTMNRIDRALKYSLGIQSVKQKKEEFTQYNPDKGPEWRTRKARRDDLLGKAQIKRIPKEERECMRF